jgi:hypothetical protein
MTFIEDARKRAKRRKSPWNIFLMLVVLISIIGFGLLFIFLFQLAHMAIYPDQYLIQSTGVGTVLATVGALLGAFIPGMLLGNFLLHLVPAGRLVLDFEAGGNPEVGYSRSQRALLRFGRIWVPICITLGLIGAMLPWQS